MRKGSNKSKEKILSLNKCSHRIVIPLYIPNEKKYYKDALKIFKYCVFSVKKTAISPIKISVISNGSSNFINDELLKMYKENIIDELIIEREGIGKINSLLKVLRTVEERLVTITDADVLFINGWEKAIIEVFESFPKAGVVCPVPVFRTHLKLTSNIWFYNLFSNKIKFLPVKNKKAMTMFANSIGWPWLDEKYKDSIGTLKAKDGCISVLGSSHFVATYKSEVFSQLPKKNTIYKLGGDSEFLYTDKPVMKTGGYRLATYDNYAYHMGNTLETWMTDTFKNLRDEKKTYNDFTYLNKLKRNYFEFIFTEKIFLKLFKIKPFYKFLLRQKGLSEDKIKNFIK